MVGVSKRQPIKGLFENFKMCYPPERAVEIETYRIVVLFRQNFENISKFSIFFTKGMVRNSVKKIQTDFDFFRKNMQWNRHGDFF